MSNSNAPTLQSVYSCEENCRRTYTDWIAVSPETTETGVADLFYTVLFNGKHTRLEYHRMVSVRTGACETLCEMELIESFAQFP
jgi:hypothetical protein